MPYVIEKDVPLPRERTSGLTHALRRMQPGQSILIAPRHRGSAYTCAKQLGLRIAIRTEGDNLRVWVIAPIDSTKEAA